MRHCASACSVLKNSSWSKTKSEKVTRDDGIKTSVAKLLKLNTTEVLWSSKLQTLQDLSSRLHNGSRMPESSDVLHGEITRNSYGILVLVIWDVRSGYHNGPFWPIYENQAVMSILLFKCFI